MNHRHSQQFTFISSMGLAIDLGATRTSSQLRKLLIADNSTYISSEDEAMRKDWEAVGNDILAAMNTFAKENDRTKKQ